MEGRQPGIVAAERLEAIVDDLATQLAALPEEAFARRPGDGEWSAAEVVAHMAEMMPYWSGAVVAASRESGRRLGRELDDPDRVGAVLDAGGSPRAEALARLRHAAHAAATEIRALDERAWGESVAHYSRGSITLGDAVRDLIIDHAQAHSEQARAAASGRAD